MIVNVEMAVGFVQRIILVERFSAFNIFLCMILKCFSEVDLLIYTILEDLTLKHVTAYFSFKFPYSFFCIFELSLERELGFCLNMSIMFLWNELTSII